MLTALLVFSLLASAPAHAAELPRAGLSPSAPEIAVLGKPAEKSATEWKYPSDPAGDVLTLSWNAEKLVRAERTLKTPRAIETVLPARQKLEDHPLDSGRDFRTPYRYLGHPQSGRIWKLQPDGRISAEIRVLPWTSRNPGRTAAQLIREGTPPLAIERKKAKAKP